MPVPNVIGRVRWPQPAALAGSIAGSDLATNMDELEQLAAEKATLQRQLHQLEQDGKREAEAADREAYARAIRNGSKDPGAVQVTKVESDIVQLRRRLDALDAAGTLTRREMQAMLDERHEVYLADAAELEAAAHDQLAATVAQLDTDVAAFVARVALSNWLDGGRQPAVPELSGLRGASGEPYGVTTVLEQLRAAVEAWKR